MITGPHSDVVSRTGPPNGLVVYNKTKTWYRQKPVTSAPLAFSSREYRSNGNVAADSWELAPDHTFSSTWTGQVQRKAYDRFKAAIAEPASLAVSIAERKQSMQMMGDRLMQLWKFTRALRRGNLTEAAHHVGLAEPPHRARMNWRRSGRNVGSTWLEYHLGWKPLIGDIFSTVDVLQRGFPPFQVRGRARGVYETVYVDDNSTERWHRQQLHVQYIGRINVSDPNLWQANQLGLINPAVVVWELVPFSFIVDWFLPIGDFLSQYTDFVGLSMDRTATTYYTVTDNEITWKPWWYYGRKDVRNAVCIDRTLGISLPPLVRSRVTGLSPTRAATAVSLLLQSLRG